MGEQAVLWDAEARDASPGDRKLAVVRVVEVIASHSLPIESRLIARSLTTCLCQ